MKILLLVHCFNSLTPPGTSQLIMAHKTKSACLCYQDASQLSSILPVISLLMSYPISDQPRIHISSFHFLDFQTSHFIYFQSAPTSIYVALQNLVRSDRDFALQNVLCYLLLAVQVRTCGCQRYFSPGPCTWQYWLWSGSHSLADTAGVLNIPEHVLEWPVCTVFVFERNNLAQNWFHQTQPLTAGQ